MRNSPKTRSLLTAVLLSAATLAGPDAAAGVVTLDQPALNPSWEADLSLLSPGAAVNSLGFTPLSLSELASLNAAVSTDSGTNEITADGWWRLRGTTTTLGFDHELESLWFEFAHERTATVEVAFLDAGGGVLDTVTLDGKTTPAGSVAFTAADGESFTSLRLTWTKAAGHAMRLGPTLTADPAPSAVPGPGALAFAGLGCVLAARRRRAE